MAKAKREMQWVSQLSLVIKMAWVFIACVYVS